MFSPVIQAHSSDSRAAMTLPTSSGSPMRPSAVRVDERRDHLGVVLERVAAEPVRVGPGETALTRMPRAPSSLAR